MAVSATVAAAPASLYVGDLHPEISDGRLFEAFSDFKSLTSVRVCRDSATGKSLCYGYVNFISHQDAMRAIESKNNTYLNGKMIRVMWSRRDPDARKSVRANVFIKNLPDSIDNAGLHDLFQEYGSILSSKVVMSEDGKSKGYGFVQFELEESANTAIKKLNGFIVRNKEIYVGEFMKKGTRNLRVPDAKYTNLYVKNLDLDITEELLKEKFSSFGKISSVVISKDGNGLSKGFAFVNYENPEDARQAMEAMNGLQYGSKNLYVARAQKKTERKQILHHEFEEKRKEQMSKYKGSNIYVKNLDDTVNDKELQEKFSSCGTITSAKVMRDGKGISKGFGFVCFSTPEEANKAVSIFHGFMFHGKPLYVAIAQRKEDRQTQLQLQYAHQLAGPSSAIIPGGFQSYFYTGGFSHMAQSGMLYPSQVPIFPNNTRQHRQNWMNGHINSLGNQSGGYIPQLQQYSLSTVSSIESSTQQQTGKAKDVPSKRQHEMEKGSGISSAGGSHGSEMLHRMLATTTPEQRKQIIGEHLYPLVHKQKPSLAAKITGMLLEMDNEELMLLLESQETLSAKVEEAAQVLKNSETKVSDQDVHHSNFLSAEVAVN